MLKTQNEWPRFGQPTGDEGFAGIIAPHTHGMSQGIAWGEEGSAASWEEERGALVQHILSPAAIRSQRAEEKAGLGPWAQWPLLNFQPEPGFRLHGWGLEQAGLGEGVPRGWNKMVFKIPSNPNQSDCTT